jgi:hypothetical protein
MMGLVWIDDEGAKRDVLIEPGVCRRGIPYSGGGVCVFVASALRLGESPSVVGPFSRD